VVLAFHSAAMNGQGMARFSGLSEKADASGFVVVYPNGTGATPLLLYWDAGGVRGRPADDVGFVARLLDDLATVVNVDASRVYATGMSNGGMLCYRLAAELSDRIAAIAPVAGTMALEACHPTRPVPVLHFHGTEDRLVLFGGPDERIPKNLKFLSVADTVRMWAKADGCPETPAVSRLPDRRDDGTVVRREVFGPGRDGSEVILYAIEGGGHTWPGRKPRVSLLGKSTQDVSANDLIWDFFQRHPMKRAGATAPASLGARATTGAAPTLRTP
jgi:polyhydroxybutyrate depolymerase